MTYKTQPKLSKNFNPLRKTPLHLIYMLILLVTFLPLSNKSSEASPAYTEVGGPIISDTTWTVANSPYIVTSHVQVMTEVTLTIESGVIVKFDTDKFLQVDGTLIARGTEDDYVTFTSTQTEPKPGDWGNIKFTESSVDATYDEDGNYTSGSILQYCKVKYGGTDSLRADGAIEIHAASPFIDHCIVYLNNDNGIYGGGTESAPIIISNNWVLYNSGSGIYAQYSIITSNNLYFNQTLTGGGMNVLKSTVTDNSIFYNSAKYWGGGIDAEDSIIKNNVVASNFATNEGGGIYSDNSDVVSNTVKSNEASHGGGIFSDNSNVVSNTVIDNTANYGGGIYNSASVLSNTIFIDNSAEIRGGGVYVKGWASNGGKVTNCFIQANSVPNTGSGSGVYISSSSGPTIEFLYNTVVGNTTDSESSPTGGVAINGSTQFHHNNLYDNGLYDVIVVTSDDISGTNNYWGTTATGDILAKVYDWYDDSDRGRLLYIPYLQEPDTNAPVPSPQNLTAENTIDSTSLYWDAIPSNTTGYGYKIYYSDTQGPPYNGTEAIQGNSPIDAGNAEEYTLSGLSDSIYYFAVTAYDSQGRESWYSDEVQTTVRLYLPLVLRST